MSFSKTISVCAALASIFGAGAAGWKLTQESQTKPVEQPKQDVSVFEEKINELEEQLKEVKEQPKPVVVQQPAIPPLPPVPEPKPGEFE
jgi:type II secretory pathway component PulC